MAKSNIAAIVEHNWRVTINVGKASLDISWLRDENLEESDNLSDPDVLVLEIVVPRLASLWTTPSEAVDRVEGSKTSKPPSNDSRNRK